MSQIKSIEVEPLPSLTDQCDCYLNDTNKYTYHSISLPVSHAEEDIPAIFRMSYMWYSFISAALTFVIGAIVSVGVEFFLNRSLKSNEKSDKTAIDKNGQYKISTISEPIKEKNGNINEAFEV